jgi:hypothetical protein
VCSLNIEANLCGTVGRWNSIAKRCELPSIKSQPDCLPSESCPVEALIHTGTTTVCPAVCVTQTSRADCASNAAFGGAVLQRWDSARNQCVMYFKPGVATNSSAAWSMCKQYRGLYSPERVWQPGVFTTKAECDAGMCVAGSQIVSANASQCAVMSSCSGVTPTCSSGVGYSGLCVDASRPLATGCSAKFDYARGLCFDPSILTLSDCSVRTTCSFFLFASR